MKYTSKSLRSTRSAFLPKTTDATAAGLFLGQKALTELRILIRLASPVPGRPR